MLCDMCRKSTAVYVKNDVPANIDDQHFETRHLCRECALCWAYNFSSIYKKCKACGRLGYKDKMTHDCNGDFFCSEDHMLSHWNFKPIAGDQV